MACFVKHRQETCLKIPKVFSNDNVTFYQVSVRVGDVSWTVNHRFRDFVDLHERLVADHSVSKDQLPPKKIIRNKDPAFIEKRRQGLEEYLIYVVNFLQRALPRELAAFLDFHKYDIIFLLQNMAVQFYSEGDHYLQMSKNFTFSPLQLHAISERLKMPCPTNEIIDKRYDFSHILDFCSQLTTIIIRGSDDLTGTSNIRQNDLRFDLNAFKSIENLTLYSVPPGNITAIGTGRDTLILLKVYQTNIYETAQIFMCDDIHKDILNAGGNLIWKNLLEIDLSRNCLKKIDASVKLVPKVEKLILDSNRLTILDNLTSLPHLSHLHLADNLIANLDDLATRVGNILTLDLSCNKISSLEGFSRIYSLERLDLGSNLITTLDEVKHLTGLPCLEALNLTGNPITTCVDYRVRTLELFGRRANEICLDREETSQKELDTVAVLQALRIVKEGRSPNFNSPTSADAPLFTSAP